MAQTTEKTNVEQTIKKIISGLNTGVMATLKNGRPWARYMTAKPVENTLKLRMICHKMTRKVQQIKEDPHVHFTMGVTPENPMGPWIQYDATVKVLDDLQVKKDTWYDKLEMVFAGPEDPNLVVLELEPEYIEVWGATKEMMKPLVWKREG